MSCVVRTQCGSVRQHATGDPTATAIRSSRAADPASSGRSAITDSISAASSTVVANGPFSATPNHEFGPRSAGTTPCPGLMPKSPQLAAGTLIEPMPSAPWAIGTIPRPPRPHCHRTIHRDPVGVPRVSGDPRRRIRATPDAQLRNRGDTNDYRPGARSLATTG